MSSSVKPQEVLSPQELPKDRYDVRAVDEARRIYNQFVDRGNLKPDVDLDAARGALKKFEAIDKGLWARWITWKSVDEIMEVERLWNRLEKLVDAASRPSNEPGVSHYIEQQVGLTEIVNGTSRERPDPAAEVRITAPDGSEEPHPEE